MWVIVSFDIPTTDTVSRKKAAQFRKDLLGDGFRMFQYSVYIRHCTSRENADAHIARVRSFWEGCGTASILRITDKQFGEVETLCGDGYTTEPPDPDALFEEL